jgi:methionyl-tRNA formyltransferase
MKVALFAAGNVGLEIARSFCESKEPPVCLVVDVKESPSLKREIIQNAGVAEDRVYRSDQLSNPDCLAELRRLSPDLILLVWWPYIVKEEIIEIPKIGCLNFHPSYLPYNRGKNYNFWTIVEDTPFGVSLHFVDKGVDSGDIAFQSHIDKTWEDTGESLYHKAQSEIVKLFKENYSAIMSGKIPRSPQDLSRGSYHQSSELDAASQIDLDKTYPARTLLNLLRARTFLPHPAAWFVDGDDKYEVRISIRRVER